MNQAVVAAWSEFNSEFQNTGHDQAYQLHDLMNRFTHAFKDAASTAVNLLVKPDELQASTSTGSVTTGI